MVPGQSAADAHDQDPQDLTIAPERQVSALVIFRKAWKSRAALLAACALTALGLAVAHTGVAHAASSPPATTLGIFISAEDGGSYSTIQGQHPNVANTYEYWGSSFPTSFADAAESAGATPFVELEPWQGVVDDGQHGNACDYSSNFPAMTTIGANGSAISSYLDSLGSAIASFGHPVILTFAHEFNIGGQYPWSEGDCEGTTAAQWIQAWDTVRSDVDSTANGLAYFMWVPGAATETGGTDTTYNPTPYWPGSSNVDMVGVDGYPTTQYSASGGTFDGMFGLVFSQIQALSSLPIFVAETNLAPLDGSGYETISNFISDLCSDGGDGVLEWEDDGAPSMTSTQWTELDNALASDCGGSSGTSAPTVTTSAASGVTDTTATLNGTVNPQGAVTTYQFQYGTSTSYGSVTPASPASAGSGSSAISESASLSGLSAGTTYDYRLVATNATGTTNGSNQTFTTPAASPPGNAFTPVGGLIQGTSLQPSVTAHAAGDVILLHVITEGNAPPTGISGGDATWTQVGNTLRGNVNSGFSAAVYEGTVSAAGTAQATVTTSGTPSAVRIGGQEYNPGSGQTGVLVSQANLDVTGTSTGPSITPTGSNELYSFYGFDTGTGSAGSTPGYTYELDNNGNEYAFDPASPAQPPVFGDSNVAFGIAVLMESAPAQQQAPVLSNGHVVPGSLLPTRANVAWDSTVTPGTWKVTINGPGFDNTSSTVPVEQADYTGLQSGHTYTVTVQQLDSSGNPWGNPGVIDFVTPT
jgi:hypothetical protein